MREIATTSVDFTNVEHLLANESLQEPNGVVVWKELQGVLAELKATQDQLNKAQLEIAKLKIQNEKPRLGSRFNMSTEPVLYQDIQSLNLPRLAVQVTVREIEPDQRQITVVLPADEDMIRPEDANAMLMVEFKGFSSGSAGTLSWWSESQGIRADLNSPFQVNSQRMTVSYRAAEFIRAANPAGDYVSIELDGVKSNRIQVAAGAIVATPDPALNTFLTDFRNWTDWDTRFGAGTWDRTYRTVATVNGVPTITFSNGATITQPQADSFYASQNLGAVDSLANPRGV